jgi:hypothetical protein
MRQGTIHCTSLQSVDRGYFTVSGGSVFVDGEYRIFKSFFDQCLAESTHQFHKFNGFRATSVPSNVLEQHPEVLDIELIRRHEHSHYRQLMSTPFGLLLWRAQNSLTSNVSFLARACCDIRPTLEIALPLHEWLYNEGFEQIGRSIRNGSRFRDDRIASVTKDLWLSSKKVAGPVAKGLRLGTLSVVARHVRAKRVGDGR